MNLFLLFLLGLSVYASAMPLAGSNFCWDTTKVMYAKKASHSHEPSLDIYIYICRMIGSLLVTLIPMWWVKKDPCLPGTCLRTVQTLCLTIRLSWTAYVMPYLQQRDWLSFIRGYSYTDDGSRTELDRIYDRLLSGFATRLQGTIVRYRLWRGNLQSRLRQTGLWPRQGLCSTSRAMDQLCKASCQLAGCRHACCGLVWVMSIRWAGDRGETGLICLSHVRINDVTMTASQVDVCASSLLSI